MIESKWILEIEKSIHFIQTPFYGALSWWHDVNNKVWKDYTFMSQLECINYFWNVFFRTLKKSGKLFMIALIFEWELVALTAINDVDLTHKKQNFLVWKVFCDVKFLDQQFLGKTFLIKTKEMVWIKGFFSLRQISCKMGLNFKVAFWRANGSFSFMQSFSPFLSFSTKSSSTKLLLLFVSTCFQTLFDCDHRLLYTRA